MQKSIFAVHDMSGVGKCSLTVAMPVLAACGHTVNPVPTALLSTSTNFEGFTFFDFTPFMREYLAHWVKLGVKSDAIYSGYLGSCEQIEIIREMHESFPTAKMYIDPVMGDNGVIYKTYTPEMCEGMKTLASIADVIMPNLTEACLLAGVSYSTEANIEELAKKMHSLGAKSVVITGIERGVRIYNCIFEDGKYFELEHELFPKRMHGTGDLFASVLVGKLLSGENLTNAVSKSADFVYDVVVACNGEGVINFEGHLGRLCG